MSKLLSLLNWSPSLSIKRKIYSKRTNENCISSFLYVHCINKISEEEKKLHFKNNNKKSEIMNFNTFKVGNISLNENMAFSLNITYIRRHVALNFMIPFLILLIFCANFMLSLCSCRYLSV